MARISSAVLVGLIPILDLGTTRLCAAEVDFAHQVAPILKEYCGKCHIGDKKKGGLSLNSRESLIQGGESGKTVFPGKPEKGDFLVRLSSTDNQLRMPPEGARVPPEKIEILKKWIQEGANWEPGYSLGGNQYEPPLRPKAVKVPDARDGVTNPIDLLLGSMDSSLKTVLASDEVFLRRVYLDLIGILPTPDEQIRFNQSKDPKKRERLVKEILGRNVDYAEHWLSFWNDLLRNDYTGTGFITGGRKQITKWLYNALVGNMPYDQFARELIAPPTVESAGFSEGIRWRGEVSAGQTVEIQFAQSVGQAFLGINLKCASCHDSFIDRWKLEDAYGLAAIFSETPLEIHRCDKPIGKKATAKWLFPELGNIDNKAPRKERLEQLARLLTDRNNGRFSRTIVNRFWHRLMGKGIVHPVDAMQTEPSNPQLLDFLANDFVDHGYDLKRTLYLIATSNAYQSEISSLRQKDHSPSDSLKRPLVKRLTAEQFLDCIWQITGTAPNRMDAQIVRGDSQAFSNSKVTPVIGKWIWSVSDSSTSPAGETISFRQFWEFPEMVYDGHAVISCDNSYTLFVNGKKVHSGDNWETPDLISLKGVLRKGKNEILVLGKNGGSGPNLAGLWFEARAVSANGKNYSIGTDEKWNWTQSQPKSNGVFPSEPMDWKQAEIVKHSSVWNSRIKSTLETLVGQGSKGQKPIRVSLVKRDFLMTTLGRPNRDQIVSVRPEELNTLEAIDLANGEILAGLIEQGANNILEKGGLEWKGSEPNGPDSAELVRALFRKSLVRDPSPRETEILIQRLGPKPDSAGIQDVLWAVFMLPEFQFIR